MKRLETASACCVLSNVLDNGYKSIGGVAELMGALCLALVFFSNQGYRVLIFTRVNSS